MSSEFSNPIAERNNPDSGEIVSPHEAYEQKKLNQDLKFFCPDVDCRDKNRILIVKKSSIDNYFFSHKGSYGHNTNPETILHKLAIKWFEGKEKFELPPFSKSIQLKTSTVLLNPNRTELEYKFYKNIIPDIKLTTTNGFEFAIEIVVTNDLDEKKLQKIQENDLPTLKIKLKDFYKNNREKCLESEFVLNELEKLLTDNSLKEWVLEPKEEVLKTLFEWEEINRNKGYIGLISLLALIGSITFFVVKPIKPLLIKNKTRFSKKPRRPKKRKYN